MSGEEGPDHLGRIQLPGHPADPGPHRRAARPGVATTFYGIEHDLATILEARRQLHRTISESPSLKAYPAEIMSEQYEIARLKAAAETRMSEDAFPVDCPFSADELLDVAFLPAD